MAIIDNLNVGDKISLSYAKDANTPSQGYTGFFESSKGDVITLRILNKGYRSFTISKIVGISIG